MFIRRAALLAISAFALCVSGQAPFRTSPNGTEIVAHKVRAAAFRANPEQPLTAPTPFTGVRDPNLISVLTLSGSALLSCIIADC
jgi:hypothetical protein